MFGRNEARGRIPWDEWSGADSWSASNAESVESAKSPFSFFAVSFNLFESEEKFQTGSSDSRESDTEDDEIEEKAQKSFFGLSWPREETQDDDRRHEVKSPDRSIEKSDIRKPDDVNDSFKLKVNGGLAESEPPLKGRFWRHARKQNVFHHYNRSKRWDNSEDVSSPRKAPNDAFFLQNDSPSSLRGYVKPKDLIQKHLLRNKNFDFRDEIEANSSRASGRQRREPAVHPSPSANQTYDSRDGIATEKKCFASWPFKNRVSSPEEMVVYEPDVKPVIPLTVEEARPTRTLKVDEPTTGASLAAKISATRKKTHSQSSNLYRFDVVDDDIWDDGTTSSGWFSLESLDGR